MGKVVEPENYKLEVTVPSKRKTFLSVSEFADLLDQETSTIDKFRAMRSKICFVVSSEAGLKPNLLLSVKTLVLWFSD